eukprot:1194992-Prorocentrum_minimum.AAC.4
MNEWYNVQRLYMSYDEWFSLLAAWSHTHTSTRTVQHAQHATTNIVELSPGEPPEGSALISAEMASGCRWNGNRGDVGVHGLGFAVKGKRRRAEDEGGGAQNVHREGGRGRFRHKWEEHGRMHYHAAGGNAVYHHCAGLNLRCSRDVIYEVASELLLELGVAEGGDAQIMKHDGEGDPYYDHNMQRRWRDGGQ